MQRQRFSQSPAPAGAGGRRSSGRPNSVGRIQSMSPGASMSRGQDRRLKDLCQDLKPILGVEPTAIFFTDERSVAFDRYKDAFEEVKFFYFAIIREVLSKNERLLKYEDDWSLVRIDDGSQLEDIQDGYMGTKLYRLICRAARALGVRPTPSYMEFGDPSEQLLQQLAEKLIAFKTYAKRCEAESAKINAANVRGRKELSEKQAYLKKLEGRLQLKGGLPENDMQSAEAEKQEWMEQISTTYKSLQEVMGQKQSLKHSLKSSQDEQAQKDYRLLEVQSQNETLSGNVVKSPRRCIQDLDNLRKSIKSEMVGLENEKSLIDAHQHANVRVRQTIAQMAPYPNQLSEIQDACQGIEMNKSTIQTVKDDRDSYGEQCVEARDRFDAEDKRLKVLHEEIDQAMMIKDQYLAELKSQHESLKTNYQKVATQAATAQDNAMDLRREVDILGIQTKERRDALNEEVAESLKLLEATVHKVAAINTDITSSFNEKFHLHNMPWQIFKTEVKTQSMPDPDEETGGAEENTLGARKSIDQDYSHRRRRSSIMAEDILQRLLPDRKMQDMYKGVNMTAWERDELARSTVVGILDKVLTGDRLTSEEQDHRRNLTPDLLTKIQEWRDAIHNGK